MKDTYQPLGDRVIIKAPEQGDTKSKKGKIILTASTTRGESTWGEVLKVGNGIRTQTGELIPMEVHVGDMVLFKKDMVGDKLTIDGVEYIMFREHDLIMVDNKRPPFDAKKLINEVMEDMDKSKFKSEY